MLLETVLSACGLITTIPRLKLKAMIRKYLESRIVIYSQYSKASFRRGGSFDSTNLPGWLSTNWLPCEGLFTADFTPGNKWSQLLFSSGVYNVIIRGSKSAAYFPVRTEAKKETQNEEKCEFTHYYKIGKPSLSQHYIQNCLVTRINALIISTCLDHQPKSFTSWSNTSIKKIRLWQSPFSILLKST